MPFPTTGILDDFNRANSGSLGANWTDAIEASPTSGWAVSSNQGVQDAANFFESSYWSAASFGPDLECFLTVRYNMTGSTRLEIWVRISSPGASNNAYIFRCGRSADDTAFGWEKNVAGANSAIGADWVAGPLVTGDKVGVQVIGTSLQAYLDTGSGWVAQPNRTDGSITSAGNIGIRARDAGVIDDFGGGTYVPPPPFIAVDYSDFPKHKISGKAVLL